MTETEDPKLAYVFNLSPAPYPEEETCHPHKNQEEAEHYPKLPEEDPEYAAEDLELAPDLDVPRRTTTREQ